MSAELGSRLRPGIAVLNLSRDIVRLLTPVEADNVITRRDTLAVSP